MKKLGSIICLSLFSSLLTSSLGWAWSFNLHSGDLLASDKVDLEWRKQTGHCPTKFPVISSGCYYAHTHIKGLPSTYIDEFSRIANFTIQNTFLLNVIVNGVRFESCQMLQQKIIGFTLVSINKEGCSFN